MVDPFADLIPDNPHAGSIQETLPLIKQLEGSGDNQESPKGAVGAYQIMPATAKQYGFDPAKLKDPMYNRIVATTILGDLHKRYNGDRDSVLVGYNAGPGVADKWRASGVDPKDRNQALLPKETQNYITKAAALTKQSAAKTSIGSDPFNDLIPGGSAVADLIPQQPQTPSATDYLRTNPVIGAPLQTLLRGGQGIEQLLVHGVASASDLGGLAPNEVSQHLRSLADQVDQSIARQNKGYEGAKERVIGASTNPRVTQAAIGTGEVMGNTLNPAGQAGNLVKGIETVSPIVNAGIRGAVSGAGFGASQPVENADNYWTGKAGQVAAGAAIGGLTGAAAEKLGGVQPPEAPTTKSLKDQASEAYKTAEKQGVIIRQDSFQNTVDDIGNTLQKEGIDATLHPKTTAVLNRLKTEAEAGDLTLEKAETLRRVAGSALDSPDKSERRLAHIVIDRLDDYVGGLKPEDLTAVARVSPTKTGSSGASPMTSDSGPAPDILKSIRLLGGIKTHKSGFITPEGGDVLAALKDSGVRGVTNKTKGLPPDVIHGILDREGWFGQQGRGDLNDLYEALKQGKSFPHPEYTAGGSARQIWEDNMRNLDAVRADARAVGVHFEKNWDASDIQAAIDERAGIRGDSAPAAPGIGNAKVAVEALNNARSLYARAAKSADIERLIERAKNAVGANYTAAGMDTALRQQFRALANKESAFRRYSPDERAAILKVVRGSPAQNALRLIGKLSPTSGVFPLVGEAGLAMAHPTIAGSAAVAGAVSKEIATRMSTGNVNALHDLIRHGHAVPRPVPKPRKWNPAPSAVAGAVMKPWGQ